MLTAVHTSDILASMTTTALQRKDHDMQTLIITPAMRFGANAFLQQFRGREDYRPFLVAVRKATYAESFPDSYTPEMVAASQRLLSLFPLDGNSEAFATATLEVLEAMRAGGHGEGLRTTHATEVQS